MGRISAAEKDCLRCDEAGGCLPPNPCGRWNGILEGWGEEPGRGVIAMGARSVPGRGVSVDFGGWS